MHSTSRSIRRCSAFALWLFLLQGSLFALQGFTTEKHPELGLTFTRPTSYEPIPVQPDEEFIVLEFAEKTAAARRDKRYRSSLIVAWIEHGPPAEAAPTEAPVPVAPIPDGGVGPTSSTRPDGKPIEPAKPPINSFERWAEQRLERWKITGKNPGTKRAGYTTREFALAWREIADEAPIRAWVHTITNEQRTLVFLLVADETGFEKQRDQWRTAIERATVMPPKDLDSANLEKRYAGSNLLGIDFRIRARQALVRGWKAEDTAHFIVLHHSQDSGMVLKVCRDIELLRKEYEKLFPPTQPIEAVSAVRICRNHDEYRLYGAPAGTAGYWNVLSEELVLFDTQALKGANKGNDANTFIVLYHEAFHQYIHYSAGGVPPHSWFNEGHGDFFSGASIAYGKVNEIGVNSWRVDEVRDALTHAYSVPWSKMIRLEKDEYYEREKVGLNYAQGWGMVYFLRKSPVVRARADWARILPTYFETLKTAFAEELERLGPEASAPLPPDAKLEAKLAYFKLREEAGKPAREKAVEAAFAGVDLTELEQAWRLYILDLPLPRAPK